MAHSSSRDWQSNGFSTPVKKRPHLFFRSRTSVKRISTTDDSEVLERPALTPLKSHYSNGLKKTLDGTDVESRHQVVSQDVRESAFLFTKPVANPEVRGDKKRNLTITSYDPFPQIYWQGNGRHIRLNRRWSTKSTSEYQRERDRSRSPLRRESRGSIKEFDELEKDFMTRRTFRSDYIRNLNPWKMMKVVKGVAPKPRRKSFSGYTNSKFVKNWRNGKTLFRTPRISKLPFPEMIKKWEERDKKALKAIRGVFSRQPQVDDDDVEESKEVMCAQDIQEGNEATGTQTFEEAKEVEHAQEVKKLAKVEEADAEFSDIELSDDGGLDSGVFSFISTPSFIRSRPRLNNVPSSLHLDSFGPNSDFE